MIPHLDFQRDQILNNPSWPFHRGELEIQMKLGAFEYVNSYAPQFIRPEMPKQHRDFYANQPFLVAAARDDRGNMWSTLLFAAEPEKVDSFVSSPDPKTLILSSSPLPGDALEGALAVGSDLGLLGIEFATRRRNRVNGRITANNPVDKQITFQVDQSFGNCPQYIKPRTWWSADPQDTSANVSNKEIDVPQCQPPDVTARPSQLTLEQVKYVQEAETIFLATGYRGHGENPAYGNDAGHRGGSAGFLEVQADNRTILLPDYNGNSHFNTIGNIHMDPSMGMTIPLYETGGMLQLSGRASIIWDEDARVAQHAGAKRLVQFEIDEVNELPPATLPIRWNRGQEGVTLQISRKVPESKDVTSFYLRSVSGESPRLPAYEAGQHLPITLMTSQGPIERSYSLSSFDESKKFQEYRISVKHHPQGIVSNLLHRHMQVGDCLMADKPSGTFIYPINHDQRQEKEVLEDIHESPVLVFLSAGIGVTPILSMIKAFVADTTNKRRALWIHSVKTAGDYPFEEEIEALQRRAGSRLTTLIQVTQSFSMAATENPESSSNPAISIGQGRINDELVRKSLGTFSKDFEGAYICGPTDFVGCMEEILTKIGLDPASIHHESF